MVNGKKIKVKLFLFLKYFLFDKDIDLCFKILIRKKYICIFIDNVNIKILFGCIMVIVYLFLKFLKNCVFFMY